MTEDRPHPGRVLVAHPGAELYGSDRVLLETVDGLLEGGWSVTVALPSDGPLGAELRVRGAEVDVVTTPVLRKSLLSPAGLVRLAATAVRGFVAGWLLVRRTAPDLVLVNTLTVPLWLLLGRLWRLPVVCHVHEAEGTASRLMRRLLAAPVLLAHRVIINSDFSRSVLLGAWPGLAGRTTVVMNGVAGPESPTPPRAPIDGPLRLVFVGRLSSRKGVDLAVGVVAELRRRGLDSSLEVVGSTFAGNETFEEELRDLAAREPGRVHFTGFVPSVWPVLARADVALVPSRLDEPFGNTAVEAVLARRPVVVSATSGLLEASAGYASAVSVEPGSVEALADGVQKLVSRWDDQAATTERDAAEAHRRHAPTVYRRSVRQIVDSLAPSSDGRR